MENILPQNANAIKTITARDASTGMSAQSIKIAVSRENASTSEALHCHVNNAIVNWDGLDRAAAKVRKHYSCIQLVFNKYLTCFTFRISD
jgi:hypothetical protein